MPEGGLEPELVESEGAEAPFQRSISYAWFDGILRGRDSGDGDVLMSSVDALNALGIVQASPAIDGGFFSVLLDEQTIPGTRMTEAKANDFVRLVQQLIDSTEDPSSVESTLRCSTVSGSQVTETLFRVQQGKVVLVSRTRAIEDRDRIHAPSTGSIPSLQGIGKGKAMTIGALLLAIFVVLSFQKGYIDLVFGSSASDISVETGEFLDMVDVQIESDWGNYKVTLVRGSGYPSNKEAVQALLEKSEGNAERAAINAVADGAELWVQLRSRRDKVLESESASLRALLAKEDGEVVLKLKGRIGVHELRLALDSGKSK